MTDEEILGKIQGIIEDMRPNVQMDGGDILFQSFENGVVQVKLEGTCATSPMSCEMLTESIQTRLTQEVEDVHEVIALKE